MNITQLYDEIKYFEYMSSVENIYHYRVPVAISLLLFGFFTKSLIR